MEGERREEQPLTGLVLNYQHSFFNFSTIILAMASCKPPFLPSSYPALGILMAQWPQPYHWAMDDCMMRLHLPGLQKTTRTWPRPGNGQCGELGESSDAVDACLQGGPLVAPIPPQSIISTVNGTLGTHNASFNGRDVDAATLEFENTPSVYLPVLSAALI